MLSRKGGDGARRGIDAKFRAGSESESESGSRRSGAGSTVISMELNEIETISPLPPVRRA